MTAETLALILIPVVVPATPGDLDTGWLSGQRLVISLSTRFTTVLPWIGLVGILFTETTSIGLIPRGGSNMAITTWLTHADS